MAKEATAQRKARRVKRQEALSARPDHDVSENCRKGRAKRQRAAEFKALPASDRKRMISPREAGQRQFGENATEAHLLTHGKISSFDAILRKEKAAAEEKRAARDQAFLEATG